MDLTEKQISEYDENGWILLPELFSKGEISILEAAAMDVLQRRGPEVAREPNGDPHVCWGMHLFDERFGALTRHPRLLLPVEQLMRSEVFVHRSRINIKQHNGSIVE